MREKKKEKGDAGRGEGQEGEEFWKHKEKKDRKDRTSVDAHAGQEGQAEATWRRGEEAPWGRTRPGQAPGGRTAWGRERASKGAEAERACWSGWRAALQDFREDSHDKASEAAPPTAFPSDRVLHPQPQRLLDVSFPEPPEERVRGSAPARLVPPPRRATIESVPRRTSSRRRIRRRTTRDAGSREGCRPVREGALDSDATVPPTAPRLTQRMSWIKPSSCFLLKRRRKNDPERAPQEGGEGAASFGSSALNLLEGEAAAGK